MVSFEGNKHHLKMWNVSIYTEENVYFLIGCCNWIKNNGAVKGSKNELQNYHLKIWSNSGTWWGTNRCGVFFVNLLCSLCKGGKFTFYLVLFRRFLSACFDVMTSQSIFHLSLQRVMFGIWIRWRWSPSQVTRQYRKPWVWRWCKILLPSQLLSISRCLHRESHWQIIKESKQKKNGERVSVLVSNKCHLLLSCFSSYVLQSLFQMILGLRKEQRLLSLEVASNLQYWRMNILRCRHFFHMAVSVSGRLLCHGIFFIVVIFQKNGK